MHIPQGWYAILSSNEIPAKSPLAIERFGIDLVAWRQSNGSPVLMSDLCPHRSVKLSGGKLIKDRIQCPFHGFEYDKSGRCQLVPETCEAAPNLKTRALPVIERHDFIWAWIGSETPANEDSEQRGLT